MKRLFEYAVNLVTPKQQRDLGYIALDSQVIQNIYSI